MKTKNYFLANSHKHNHIKILISVDQEDLLRVVAFSSKLLI